MTRSRWARWAALAAITVLIGVFSWLNSGERVSLHLGLFVLYQVPIVLVFYTAFLLGMVMMFILGLRHDLQVRRVLAQRGLLDAPPAPGRAPPPGEPPAWGDPNDGTLAP